MSMVLRRQLRSDVKKLVRIEIQSFFEDSPLPRKPVYEYLESAVEQCVEWKRYVEQDAIEEYQTEEEPQSALTTRKATRANTKPTVANKDKKKEQEELNQKYIDAIDSYTKENKLWVLSGLQQKPTKSTKIQKFQLELPKGEGLRLLNSGKDFKMPWNVYCPTVSDERKVVFWKHSLKMNEWKVKRNFEPVKSQKCSCPYGNCDANCSNRSLQNECSPQTCASGENDCGNRQFTNLLNDLKQMSKYASGYEVVDTGAKGLGLVSVRSYDTGSLIVEYTGEVIDLIEVGHRLDTVYKDKSNYYFLGLEEDLIIDAGQRGSVARFANHSCNPNSEIQKWYVDNEPKIGLFAIRHIQPDEEIVYDYNFKTFENSKPLKCECGSANCRSVISKIPEESKSVKKVEEGELSDLSDLSADDDAFDRSSTGLDGDARVYASKSKAGELKKKKLPPPTKAHVSKHKIKVSAPPITKTKVSSGKSTYKSFSHISESDDNGSSELLDDVDDPSEEENVEQDPDSLEEGHTSFHQARSSKRNQEQTKPSNNDIKPLKRKRFHISDPEDENLEEETVVSPIKSSSPLKKAKLSVEHQKTFKNHEISTNRRELEFKIRAKTSARDALSKDFKKKESLKQSLSFDSFSNLKKSKRSNAEPVVLKSRPEHDSVVEDDNSRNYKEDAEDDQDYVKELVHIPKKKTPNSPNSRHLVKYRHDHFNNGYRYHNNHYNVYYPEQPYYPENYHHNGPQYGGYPPPVAPPYGAYNSHYPPYNYHFPNQYYNYPPPPPPPNQDAFSEQGPHPDRHQYTDNNTPYSGSRPKYNLGPGYYDPPPQPYNYYGGYPGYNYRYYQPLLRDHANGSEFRQHNGTSGKPYHDEEMAGAPSSPESEYSKTRNVSPTRFPSDPRLRKG